MINATKIYLHNKKLGHLFAGRYIKVDFVWSPLVTGNILQIGSP